MPDPADVLPASLEEAERNAERIAAVARAGAAVAIALAVAAAMTVMPDETHSYVLPQLYTALLTMAGFLLVAGASWYASRRRPYRAWTAYLFAVLDAGLIGTALVAGLSQAGHPGHLVFAQPAVWLIPVVLAIQAVRFRNGPLLLSAALYVAELLVLVLLSAPRGTGPGAAGGAGTLVDAFDVPPDVVRILMLAVASAVLVFAVRDKRRILARGLAAAGREAALNRFLPPEVSRSLGSQARPPAAQRTLAILFVDLVGFTRAGERADPPDVARWLAAYRDRVDAVVRAHGGFIDKFIGDGVMATFGYDGEPESAARAALTAIPALAAAIEDWRRADPEAPRLQLAVGGALGPVFVGVIGAGARREFTVVGDAVNVAARLEGIAKEQGALAALNRDLVTAAGPAGVAVTDLGPVELRGRAGSVAVCLVPRPAGDDAGR